MTIKAVIPGETRLGWIGTGVMGISMCGHLLQAGFKITVFNRSKSRTEPLLAKGAVGPTAHKPWPKLRISYFPSWVFRRMYAPSRSDLRALWPEPNLEPSWST